jgi:hypothetical protein
MVGKDTQAAITLPSEIRKKQLSSSKTKKHIQTSKSSAYALDWTLSKEK